MLIPMTLTLYTRAAHTHKNVLRFLLITDKYEQSKLGNKNRMYKKLTDLSYSTICKALVL